MGVGDRVVESVIGGEESGLLVPRSPRNCLYMWDLRTPDKR